MDSVVSWGVVLLLGLAGGLWLFWSRVQYLESIHTEKPPCVLANARRGKDWQAFYTGHTY